jgi:hypothetical protein
VCQISVVVVRGRQDGIESGMQQAAFVYSAAAAARQEKHATASRGVR